MKYLLAEKHFGRIVTFEQRNKVGGLWNYTVDDDLAKAEAEAQSIPQTSHKAPLDLPVWRLSGAGDMLGATAKEATFASPMYDDLETNIPKELMQYSDYPFSEELRLFPEREKVLRYLEEYAQEVRHLIRFQIQVYDVQKVANGGWIVRFRNLETEQETEEPYDAVLVASGHYDVPYIPAIRGLKEWNKTFPGSASHSKFYRRPDDYKGKKVIVVGNSASGLDIGLQIAAVCKQPLLVSQRSGSYLSPGPSPDKVELPEVVQFDVASRTAVFSDGRRESDIDAVLFCTGYFYNFPFLSSLQPPLISNGTRVQNLYQHVFWIPDPTLAFLVLNQKVLPFPFAQAQAAVISRIWPNRLALPSEQDMKEWEATVIRERGPGKTFHNLQYPSDARYINTFHDWAEESPRREGLERDGQGRESPHWGQRYCWLRERFPAIRKAFRAAGESRNQAKTVEQVGFDFEAFHAEAASMTAPAKSSL